MNEASMTYVEADAGILPRIVDEYGPVAARHMHFDDGFSILAMCGERIAGLLAVRMQDIPEPAGTLTEGYVDIIEVGPEFRRLGVGREMVARASDCARERGAYQLRAWSSDDKAAAISMWPTLGFGLHPDVVQSGGKEVRGVYVTMKL